MSGPAAEGPRWGWTPPVGRLLAAGGFALACAIGLTAPPGRPAGPPPPPLRADPNTAPRLVLLALPRIGPARAGAILAARKQAPYRSLADLDARVPGIGPATAAALAPHLAFPNR